MTVSALLPPAPLPFLLLPLILPWGLPPLARRVADRIRPDIALWTVTAAAAVLALGVLACLGALLLPPALAVPPLAQLAELVRPLNAGPRALVLGAAAPAAGALAVTAAVAVRRAIAEARRFRAAHEDVAGLPHAGGLCVVDDPRAEAYALPGARRRADRIVVTTGMLRALSAPEREALLAHERAHLSGRHHLFLATGRLAGWCHPALTGVVRQVSYAAERTADEAAARAAGDRGLTARAVGRAALATTQERADRPSFAPGAVGGPVPARVKALLGRAPTRRVAPALLAMALLCGISGGSATAGLTLLHRDVEVAQGDIADL
ncbi:integral membrane protein [Streptomyces laurentii]|uniref:Integral membrane protein n=1 Tax=Streptomyces laurentii TaxID=39478 RepID=A0A160P8N1_STRLU|nr:integral membrane protein [Streptomyces laurentii]